MIVAPNCSNMVALLSFEPRWINNIGLLLMTSCTDGVILSADEPRKDHNQC